MNPDLQFTVMMVGLNVRRRVGEALLSECIAPTVKFGGGGVMVWGALTARGPGLLKTVRGNLNGIRYINIFGDCMVPSAHLHAYRDYYIFRTIIRHAMEPGSLMS